MSDQTSQVVGPSQKPNPHPVYGDNWERGKDPWHSDAFPDDLKHAALNHGERKGGWYLLDHWKNEIGFVEDGTPL